MRKSMVGLILLVATPAWADQCAWVTAAQAEAAVALLHPGTKWLALCEPCGESNPTPSTVSTVQAKRVPGDAYREVSINGDAVDLAYTFVQGSKPGVYDNLAKKVGCGAFDVSDQIRWPPGSAKEEPSWTKAGHALTGTYSGPRGTLTLRLSVQINKLSISVRTALGRPLSEGPRVELSSLLNVGQQPLAFETGLGACTMGVEQVGAAVELTPAASCHGLLDTLAGRYERVR